jgi:DNA repair protein RadC
MFKDSYREMVVVVGMDNSNCPTVIHTVGVGSPNQSVVCMASIFKPLLLSNAISFILCHNHLCDQMNPSQADRDLTDKIGDIAKMLELHLLDHLILNADGTEHISFRKMGMLKA